jgi:hypothetical protein
MTKKKNKDLTRSIIHSRPEPSGKMPDKRTIIKKKNKNIKFGAIIVKSGTVILNDITYDENTNNLMFDYTIEEEIAEEQKEQIENELKEFFDKQIKANFLTFIKNNIKK